MRPTTRPFRAPALRRLRDDDLRAPPEFWDDPDLAPRRRRETPLTSWT